MGFHSNLFSLLQRSHCARRHSHTPPKLKGSQQMELICSVHLLSILFDFGIARESCGYDRRFVLFRAAIEQCDMVAVFPARQAVVTIIMAVLFSRIHVCIPVCFHSS